MKLIGRTFANFSSTPHSLKQRPTARSLLLATKRGEGESSWLRGLAFRKDGVFFKEDSGNGRFLGLLG
jgi:hypothetical protein